ncbi:uncharacterized protein LAESUDRAFT_722169 [Laetiporus sulphureus 93-53]|uniref:Uncharacterized protein n=1 Tax=Laetiporus sulphureus 93-53 TaxID=1314785 RepID=A0A165G9G4_9APHY|nr:uncharacterized protein LAESUDRAFT_722169 [Laetiporus sulphureus 93-53]KZT10022.1 hypothetical protein LAESUDRAFT_722169 [Laetiporus sulphureus 93-53]
MPPIARIPADLLHDIFDLVAHAEGAGRNHNLNGSINCIPVSHVCRDWRSLSLASPMLWSVLHLDVHSSVAMLREFLERSRDAPLFVKMQGPSSVWSSTEDIIRMARVLSDHSSRFKAFHVVSFLSDDMKSVLAPFTSPAPNLRQLSLSAASYTSNPAIFTGWMPMLREVLICSVSMPWVSYQNLVELELSDQVAPSLEDLLWSIRNSPSIEILCLDLRGALRVEDSGTVSQQQCINLQNLRKLALGSAQNPDDVLKILACLSFPVTTSVDLQLRYSEGATTQIDIRQCSPSIAEITSGIDKAFLQFVSSHTYRHITLGALDGLYTVKWEWDVDDGGDVAIDNVVLSTIDLPALQSLKLQTYGFYVREETWLNVLKLFPTIDMLEIDFRTVHHIVPATIFSVLAENGNDGKVVCPNLTHLIVSLVGDVDIHIWSNLVVSVLARQRLGARRLALLDVTFDGALPAALIPLNNIVGQVEVRKRQNPRVKTTRSLSAHSTR